MRNSYFLYLITAMVLLGVIFVSFMSTQFLLESIKKTREINDGSVQLQNVDVERYNELVKKGM